MQRKRCPADHAAVGGDDFRTDAVDGTEFQLLGQIRTEPLRKALTHVVSGGDGIGYGENLTRRDIFAQKHIAKTCDENRCFAGTGYGKNKDRAVDGLHRFLLLRSQGQLIL